MYARPKGPSARIEFVGFILSGRSAVLKPGAEPIRQLNARPLIQCLACCTPAITTAAEKGTRSDDALPLTLCLSSPSYTVTCLRRRTTHPSLIHPRRPTQHSSRRSSTSPRRARHPPRPLRWITPFPTTTSPSSSRVPPPPHSTTSGTPPLLRHRAHATDAPVATVGRAARARCPPMFRSTPAAAAPQRTQRRSRRRSSAQGTRARSAPTRPRRHSRPRMMTTSRKSLARRIRPGQSAI